MQSPPWSANTRLIVAMLIVLGLITLFVLALPLFVALTIAALFAFLLDPLVRLFMGKFRLRRSWAVVLVYALTLLVVASIPALMGTLAIGQLERLSSDLQSAIVAIEKWISQPILIFGFDLSPRNIIQQFGAFAGSAMTNVTGSTLSIISGITTNFLWVLLTLVSLFYFMKDGPKIKPWLINLAPPSYQLDVARLLDELDRVWSLFMRVQVLIFAVLAILFLLGSVLVVYLYQLDLIPFSTLGLIVTLILVYALVQQVDNLWLRPQLMGSQLELHPAVVFISLIGALAIGGVLAAIMIVPMLASMKVIGHYVRSKLLNLPPWPEESEQEA